eukprot:scpid69158/ scgid4040/ 
MLCDESVVLRCFPDHMYLLRRELLYQTTCHRLYNGHLNFIHSSDVTVAVIQAVNIILHGELQFYRFVDNKLLANSFCYRQFLQQNNGLSRAAFKPTKQEDGLAISTFIQNSRNAEIYKICECHFRMECLIFTEHSEKTKHDQSNTKLVTAAPIGWRRLVREDVLPVLAGK